tara:strand:- start:34 stop:291 length:258 start_codon:yes stop_codon:yes gene_type:complete
MATETTTTEIKETGEYNIITVRKTTTVTENGVIISMSNHRTTYDPLTDVSSLDSDVAELANSVWTDEIKSAYQNYIDSTPVVPWE